MVIGSIAFSIVFAGAASAATAPISGGGTSAAQLEIDQWMADTAHAPYNLSNSYSAQGSESSIPVLLPLIGVAVIAVPARRRLATRR